MYAQLLVSTIAEPYKNLVERENALSDKNARPRMSLKEMINAKPVDLEGISCVVSMVALRIFLFIVGGTKVMSNVKAAVAAQVAVNDYRRLVFMELLFDLWQEHDFLFSNRNRTFNTTWSAVLRSLFELTDIDFEAIEDGSGFVWNKDWSFMVRPSAFVSGSG